MLSFLLYYSVVFCASVVLSAKEAVKCQGTARYTLTFQAEWTRDTHPDFPSNRNPHFSPLVGCSHNASYVMWKPKMLATTGVKDVAETGIIIHGIIIN